MAAVSIEQIKEHTKENKSLTEIGAIYGKSKAAMFRIVVDNGYKVQNLYPKTIIHKTKARHCSFCGKLIDMSKYELTKYAYKYQRTDGQYEFYCGWTCQHAHEQYLESKKKKRKPSYEYDGYQI